MRNSCWLVFFGAQMSGTWAGITIIPPPAAMMALEAFWNVASALSTVLTGPNCSSEKIAASFVAGTLVCAHSAGLNISKQIPTMSLFFIASFFTVIIERSSNRFLRQPAPVFRTES